jgi:hypothetical protein
MERYKNLDSIFESDPMGHPLYAKARRVLEIASEFADKKSSNGLNKLIAKEFKLNDSDATQVASAVHDGPYMSVLSVVINALEKIGIKESVNEGSYDDFMDTYAVEMRESVKNLKELHADLQKIGKDDDDRYENIMQFIDDGLSKIYDNVNVQLTMEALNSDRFRITNSEIGQVALNMTNRHGTEMHTVLQCMDDAVRLFYRATKKFPK